MPKIAIYTKHFLERTLVMVLVTAVGVITLVTTADELCL